MPAHWVMPGAVFLRYLDLVLPTNTCFGFGCDCIFKDPVVSFSGRFNNQEENCMRKIIPLFLGIMSLALAPALAYGEQTGRANASVQNKFIFQKQVNQLNNDANTPSAGDGSSGVTFLILPEFHYSNHGNLSTNLGGTNLKASGGDATAWDFLLIGTKKINDLLTLALTYQFAYTEYSGGLLVPQDGVAGVIDSFSGKSEFDTVSNLIGLDATFNFNEYGKLNIGLAQAWDIYNGNETQYRHLTGGGTETDRRSIDEQKTRVSSIMAWYDVDLPINERWTFNPYVGWRSVYGVISNQNDWSAAPGTKTGDDGAWTHLASAGLKFKYQGDNLGAYMRAGINHRVSSDDVPGLGSRAMAPGVVHFGHMTNMDRTVGTWGLGFNYAVSESLVLDLGYNGYAGSDVDVHSAMGALVFPF